MTTTTQSCQRKHNIDPDDAHTRCTEDRPPDDVIRCSPEFAVVVVDIAVKVGAVWCHSRGRRHTPIPVRACAPAARRRRGGRLGVSYIPCFPPESAAAQKGGELIEGRDTVATGIGSFAFRAVKYI